ARESAYSRWDRHPEPGIATCSSRGQGGKVQGSIEEELRSLQYGVENGAKFIDIDHRFARSVAGARVIGSLHDFAGTPGDIDAVLERACAGPAQIAKVATLVNSWSDNRRLLSLLSRSWSKPVIVTGMV